MVTTSSPAGYTSGRSPMRVFGNFSRFASTAAIAFLYAGFTAIMTFSAPTASATVSRAVIISKAYFSSTCLWSFRSGSHSAQLSIMVSAFSLSFAYDGNPAPPAPAIPASLIISESFVSSISFVLSIIVKRHSCKSTSLIKVIPLHG